MLEIYHSKKGTPYVWASELHRKLEIATPLRKWFPRMIEYGFDENIDYYLSDKKVRKSDVGRPSIDWAVQIEMAKHIAMIQRSAKGKAMRAYLLNLDDKVQNGLLLSRNQFLALYELIEIFGFFSVQRKLERDHYEVFESKHESWWAYRARVFGQSANDLKEIMRGLNKVYKSQRQALLHIDKFELIRRASFDLFKKMGKSDEYAKNMSRFAKDMAEKANPEIYDDESGGTIDFKTRKQNEKIKMLNNPDEPNGLLEAF